VSHTKYVLFGGISRMILVQTSNIQDDGSKHLNPDWFY